MARPISLGLAKTMSSRRRRVVGAWPSTTMFVINGRTTSRPPTQSTITLRASSSNSSRAVVRATAMNDAMTAPRRSSALGSLV